MSIRSENDSLRENTYAPKPRGGPRAEGGGGMSHSVRRMDEMEMSGQGTREASLQ